MIYFPPLQYLSSPEAKTKAATLLHLNYLYLLKDLCSVALSGVPGKSYSSPPGIGSGSVSPAAAKAGYSARAKEGREGERKTSARPPVNSPLLQQHQDRLRLHISLGQH
jgi:hypothetical protein